MTTLRPQPQFPEPDTESFWEATKQHKLTYQTCDPCGNVIFYPRRHCPNCGSAENTVKESRGEGVIYTFSVIMQSRHPAFKDLGAFAVAYVDLDEGFRMMTNIVGVQNPVADLQCGMRVVVDWQDQGEGNVSLPMFRLL